MRELGGKHAGLSDLFMSVFLDDPRQENSNRDLEELEVVLADKVKLEIVKMTPVPDDGTFRLDRFSGQFEHQLLCAAVAKYLDGLGREWTILRKHLRCPGGIADIITTDGRLVVEAGCTRAKKVVSCLADGRQVMLVPFDGDGEMAFLLTPKGSYKSILAARSRVAEEVADKLDRMVNEMLAKIPEGEES
jgi:hypothetical protein